MKAMTSGTPALVYSELRRQTSPCPHSFQYHVQTRQTDSMMASESHDAVHKDMVRSVSHTEASSDPLSQRMSQASRGAHSVSNALVAARLAVVCTDKVLYGQTLAAFWHVHAALEAGIAKNASHEALKTIARLTKMLDRAAAFEADLHYLLGPTWKSQVEQRPPAVAAYVQHLAEISASDPVRLVAHAYTQQMALLAGGQRIRKFVTSTVPGLQGKDGVSVFCFEEPVDPLKQEYKQAVDGLEDILGNEATQKVLEEHVRVFEMNNAIIKGFPLRTLDTLTAIKRILPPEVILTACATVFALVMMWLTPKVLEVAKAWEVGADAFSTDAVETTQSRSQEL